MNGISPISRAIIVPLFSLLFTTLACSGGGGYQDARDEERTTREDVAESVEETAETLGDYAADTKEGFVGMIRARLAVIDQGIEDLKMHASESRDVAEEEWSRTLEQLSEKRQAIRQDLKKLQADSGRAWQDMRSGIDNAVVELERAFQNAKDEFES